MSGTDFTNQNYHLCKFFILNKSWYKQRITSCRSCFLCSTTWICRVAFKGISRSASFWLFPKRLWYGTHFVFFVVETLLEFLQSLLNTTFIHIRCRKDLDLVLNIYVANFSKVRPLLIYVFCSLPFTEHSEKS